MRILALLFGLMAATAVGAQSGQPAASAPEAAPATTASDDAPVGLFITPWRNATAEQATDRPARLLQSDLSPVDQAVFERQVEYHDALEAHAAKKAAPASK